MAEKSYDEIMRMIINACDNYFYNDITIDEAKTIIECTTQIYIAQMNKRTPKERGEEK